MCVKSIRRVIYSAQLFSQREEDPCHTRLGSTFQLSTPRVLDGHETRMSTVKSIPENTKCYAVYTMCQVIPLLDTQAVKQAAPRRAPPSLAGCVTAAARPRLHTRAKNRLPLLTVLVKGFACDHAQC